MADIPSLVFLEDIKHTKPPDLPPGQDISSYVGKRYALQVFKSPLNRCLVVYSRCKYSLST